MEASRGMTLRTRVRGKGIGSSPHPSHPTEVYSRGMLTTLGKCFSVLLPKLGMTLLVGLSLAGAQPVGQSPPPVQSQPQGVYLEGRVTQMGSRSATVDLGGGRSVEAEFPVSGPEGFHIGQRVVLYRLLSYQLVRPDEPSRPGDRQGRVLEFGLPLVRVALPDGSVQEVEASPQEAQALWVGQSVRIRQVEGRAFLVEPLRLGYLYALLGLFVVAVLLLGRGKGLRGLIGTAASLLVLVYGVVPLITRGANPLLVTFAGAFGILLLSIYFVHGVGRKTTAALLGTSLAVAISLGLAALFTRWMGFTGLTSEEAFLARFALQNLDLVSLYLAGVVVGALGALNDVTVTQASVTQALALANPRYSLRELYQRGMSVGFDHIGSLVNTLVLAYSAGSLPLMLLIQQGSTPLRFLLNQEPFMAEFVSMLVGSLGLVLAVPFTTFVAACFFHGGNTRYIEQRWPKPQRPAEGRSWVQDMLEKDKPK